MATDSALRSAATAARDTDVIADLRRQLDDVTRERDQILRVVDLLRELQESGNVEDILQRVAHRLGEIFGLDRSSIYLADRGPDEARLVATFEDPTLQDMVVDLARYPELREAFHSGRTVFIPDAFSHPMLAGVRHTLDQRRVRSIVVVPIRWRSAVIGAVFLRSDPGAPPISARDIRSCEVIAGLTGCALQHAPSAPDE